jgi:hypothetical protein
MRKGRIGSKERHVVQAFTRARHVFGGRDMSTLPHCEEPAEFLA